MAVLFPVAGLLFFLSLQVRADVAVQKDFDPKQFCGTWHGVGAVSNCSDFLKMKDDMTQPIIMFALETDSSLKCSIGYRTPDGCKMREVTYEPISSGRYMMSGPNGEKTAVTFVGTDYKKYALEYTHTEKANGVTTTMIKLYGKDEDLPKEIQQQFETYALNMGFEKKHIVLFPAAEPCVPGTF